MPSKQKEPFVNSEKNSRINSKTSKSNSINETPKLSTKDRLNNIFIGATLGLGVGGAIVSVAAMPLAVIIGGQAAVQIFAIGALAFNAEAIIFAPFYAVELEPIEWEAPSR